MAGFNYNGPSPMGLAAYVQQQGQLGKQQGEDSRLGRLVSGAMTDPSKRQANLAEVASFRPEAAFQAQGQFNQQDDRKYAELGKRAAVLAGAPDAVRDQLYQQMRPELEATFGMKNLPPNFTPDMLPMAQQLASVYGGQSGNDVPSDIRSLRMLQADPSLLETNDRYRGTYTFDQQFDKAGNPIYNARNNRTGSVAPAPVADTVATPGGEPASGLPDVSDLVGNGVVMTSWSRSAADNDRVGGKSNSRHLSGQGVDFVVPQAQKAEWTRRAQAKGLQVIDEGDHMHVQVPRGPAPILGQSDADRAAAAAEKVRAEETMRRQLGLEYAGPEADAAADAARKKKEAEAEAERNAKGEQRQVQAQESIANLEEAIRLLPDATGSKLGALRDATAGLAGLSTTGAQAAATLRTIAAKIVGNVPRFEGPQSNIDVQFYKQAAGDLDNENIPVETRLATARAMLEMARKYSGTAPSGQSGGGENRRLRYNPETGELE